MINIGVIGLGPLWEDRYRPALQRLSRRMRVCAVYDPVFARAELTASEHNARPEYGLIALAKSSDVDAVLLLETAWHGCEALRLLCASGKPMYIAADLGDEPAMLLALHWTAVNFGMTLMPELGVRYTPSSNRLQELMATRLGRPRRIRIGLNGEARAICSVDPVDPHSSAIRSARRTLIDWFDWLRYVVRTPPEELELLSAAESSASQQCSVVHIGYSKSRNSDVSPTAELHLALEDSPVAGLEIGRPEVECEHGIAYIQSSTVIRWKAHGDVKFVTESLLSDRSEVEVMLDHFCRRVVGGLIPVADLADISRSLELIKAAQQSARAGAAILLNGCP